MKGFFLLALSLLFFNLSASNVDPSSKKLHLSYLNLKTVDLDSLQAASLTEIDLSGNPIKNLPANILYARELKSIKLNSCNNIDWESTIKLLKNLAIEEIEMNYCNLTYIPYELGEIKSLKKISVKGNVLKDLPWNLFLNKNLISLNLENNNIEHLGKEINSLENLASLDLSGNPCLSDENFWKALEGMNTLKVLSCNNCKKLPKTVILPPTLEEFNLNDCSSGLPEKIIHSNSVKKLSLLNNSFDSEGALSLFVNNPIQELSLSGFNIIKLNNSILFPTLQTLNLECGKLSEVSNMITLTNLSSFKIQCSDTNTTTQILSSLNPKSLKKLEIKNSAYRMLPNVVKEFTQLENLNIQRSNIQNTFTILAGLDSLKEIDIRGNSLQDTSAIAAFQKKHKNTVLYYDVNMPQKKKSGYLNKPFPDLVLPSQKFTVKADQDVTLIANDGSTILIPANSIVDKNNKPIKEEVNITYTTYRAPEEVFASGIPMTADSAGQKFNFASAGMFSLDASLNNGQKAYLKKGKEIKVDFTSAYPNDTYNYYYLDTVKKNWVQTGKDKVKPVDQIKPKPKEMNIDAPLNPHKVVCGTIFIKTKYRKPKKKEKTKFEIYYTLNTGRKHADSIMYDPKEIGPLQHMEWEYAGTDDKEFYAKVNKESGLFSALLENKSGIFKKNIDYRAKSKEGVEFHITLDKSNDYYNFVFSSNTDSLVIPALPLVNSENPLSIQKENKKIYEKYVDLHKDNTAYRGVRLSQYIGQYTLYTRRMASYNRILNAYNDRKISYNSYMELYQQYTNNNIDSVNKMNVDPSSITRSLSLTGFGTYNCDYFFRLDNPIVCSPKFYNKETGERVKVKSLTLIDLKENAYISNVNTHLKLGKRRDYWIFTTNTDGTIGFAAITTNNKNDFEKIDIKEIKAGSIEELRKELKY